jgi:hypothetical protein
MNPKAFTHYIMCTLYVCYYECIVKSECLLDQWIMWKQPKHIYDRKMKMIS